MAKRTAAAAPDPDELEEQNRRLEQELSRREKLLKKRKKLAAEEAALSGDGAGEEDGPLPGAEKIQRILADLGGEGSFDVVKFNGAEEVHIGTYEPDSWPIALEEAVRAHGGGTYQIRVRDEDGQLVKRIKRTYGARTGAAGAHAAAPATGDPFKLLEFLEKRDALLRSEVEKARMEADKTRDQLQATMLKIVEASGQKSFLNDVQQLSVLAKLFGGRNLLDQIDEIEELRERFGAGGDAQPAPISTDNPAVALLTRLVDVLGPKVAAMLPAGTAQPPAGGAPKKEPAPSAPPPAAELPAGKPQTPPPAEPQPAGSTLDSYRESFRAAIQGGYDPLASAATVWKAVAADAAKKKAIVDIVEKGDWSPLLEDPFLKDHTAWLGSFRDELHRLIATEKNQASA